MRAPISWLREHAEVPDQVSPRELAAALIGVGMEVETVDVVGEVCPVCWCWAGCARSPN